MDMKRDLVRMSERRLWEDKRLWNILMATALMLGGVWILASRVPESKVAGAVEGLVAAPREGFLAPDFNLTALDGTTVRLSDLRGKPVLINFWASWCGPCRVEMPHIQSAFITHADEELVVLAVNQLESPPVVAQYVQEHTLTFPIPLDSDGKVSALYKARALPTTFFVDAEGIIRDMFTGPMSSGLLESKLESLFSSKMLGGGE